MDEFGAAVDDRTVAWVIGRNKPVVLLAKKGGERLVFHALSTPSRTRGLFLGVLDHGKPDREIGRALMTIVLMTAAHVLESREVYGYVHRVNEELKAAVERLKTSEEALRERGGVLEEEVARRTEDLSKTVSILEAEAARRRLVEAELKAEGAFVSAVLDAAKALVAVIDEEGGVIRTNPAFEAELGGVEPDREGRRFWDRFPKVDDVRLLKARFDGLLADVGDERGKAGGGEDQRLEARIGRGRTASWSFSTLQRPDRKGALVIAAGLDVTELKSAEAALRDSEARFKAFFMEAGNGVAISNPQGELLDANPFFCRMTGRSRTELIGASFVDFTHPDDVGVTSGALKALADGAQSLRFEKRYLTAKGDVWWGQATMTLVRDAKRRPLYHISMIEDVTERKRMETALREAEESYRSIFENAVEGVFQASLDGSWLKVNPAMARMLGFVSPEALAVDDEPALKRLGVDEASRLAFIETLKEHGSAGDVELRARRRDGGVLWISVSARAMLDRDGCFFAVEGLAEDIDERKESEMFLRRQASYDGLTDIPNRRLFQDRLEQMIAQARRMGHGLVLLFIDLDGFKRVNDRFGHGVGDVLLKQVAGRLKERVRRSDTLARMGGDEFVVLLTDVVWPQDVERWAAEVIESLTKPFCADGADCVIGASIGAAIYPLDTESPDELVRKADRAMYKAKTAGGNRLAFYDEAAARRLPTSGHLCKPPKDDD